MLSQPGLRTQTSTASFVVVSRAPASPPSPACPTPPRPSPDWPYTLLLLAALDFVATLVLSTLNHGDGLLLSTTVAVTRSAIVAAVGWSRHSSLAGFGGGWVSAMSTLTVLVILWELNLLYQTRARPADLAAHGPALAVTLPAEALHHSSSMLLAMGAASSQAHVILLGVNLAFALAEEAVSFKAASRLPGVRGCRTFGVRPPRQAPSSFSFDITSSRLESFNNDPSDRLYASDEAESEDELSESEIVDIPPPRASTAASLGAASPEGNLERSLSRSWSRRRLHDAAGRGPSGSSPTDEATLAAEDDGYGTFRIAQTNHT